ncbi:MAG: PAS domain S-box protein [Candidatus Latescibacteria bacterium]|nr:PAS domain S-box protein [Candidatus Latescibacterota bacterium]
MSGKKTSILVADDEPEALGILKGLLETEGYDVDIASDGIEALEKFKAKESDILLTDLKMPGLDGIKLSRKVKKLNPRTEIILITAYSSLESAISAMRDGISDYISKPINIPHVLDSIKRVLKKRDLSTRKDKLVEELSSVSRELEEHAALAEQKSIQYQKLYQGIISSIPSSILLIDRNLRVVSANRNFLEKSKKSESVILGKTIDEIFPSVLLYYTQLGQKARGVFETGQSVEGGEMTYRAPGLPARVYFYGLAPIKGENGSVENVMLLMDDITERIRLSEEIRRAERHLASVVESASDIVVSMGAKGNITTWNKAGETLLGFKSKEVVGKQIATLCAGEAQGDMKSTIRKLVRGKSIQNAEINLMTKSGNRLLISWSCSPMRDDTGKIVGIVGVGRDLSERRLLEAQLIQSAKMASLGVMAGGIAHEIRNPLAICSSAAQLLLEDSEDKEMRTECADKIYSNIHRASQVIENLLKFARASGEDLCPVGVNEALKETLSLIEHQIRLQQIELNTKFAKNLPALTGNKNLLQQVFLNMILNAYNAMPQGGKLTISTRLNPDDQIEIRFVDTGCGIPKENLQKIFDPFFTTMPVGKGTGLGLWVSYGIVEQHGGSIHVESKVDVGTTFTVKLPLTRE